MKNHIFIIVPLLTHSTGKANITATTVTPHTLNNDTLTDNDTLTGLKSLQKKRIILSSDSFVHCTKLVRM